MSAETSATTNTPESLRTSRRRALAALAGGAAAAGALVASPAQLLAQEWTGETLPDGNTSPFSYRLAASEPQTYAGGSIYTATKANIPALVGLSINLLEVLPGAVREIHWHPNAAELNYCLEGEGEIGVLSTTGEAATFAISPGVIAFLPIGDAHYIRNTGAEVLRLLIGFSNENASHQTLSETLPWVPSDLLNQTLGVAPGTLPTFPPRGDLAIVPVEPSGEAPASPEPTAFSTHIEDIKLQQFGGGTVQAVRIDAIARLDSMTLLKLDIDAHSIREPHWHGNASEFNFCASGTALVGIVSPDGESWTFTLETGDVAFIPKNWFHYIAAVGDAPVVILAFFDATAPNRIDLTSMASFFAPELMAASFGVDPATFGDLPDQGTVVIAGPVIDAPATPQP